MKAFSFSHWDSICDKKTLLFFAQCLEEMLFHYGHDSLKVPALNFRYLCMEMANTLQKVDAGIIDKGNVRPLFDELHHSFLHDPVARALYGTDFPKLFYSKNANGEYERNCNDIFKEPGSENAIRQIKRVVSYLLNDMSMENKYFKTLKSSIEEAITSNPFAFEQQRLFRQLCEILLTDLINCSYSQEYIYLVVNNIFYNPQKRISNTATSLEQFWNSFDFNEKEYTVILPLKQSMLKKHLRNFQNINIKNNINGEFGNSCKWVIELELDAMDPEQARSRATSLASFFVSLLQYNNHKSRPFTAEQAIVIEKNDSKRYYLKEPVTPLRRGANIGDMQNNEKIAEMVENFSFSPHKLISVIELHSSALESSEISNQLLNLWTIIEILIDTEHKNSYAKINQICNALTSVLNNCYIHSLMAQLLADFEHCASEKTREILADIDISINDVVKVFALLVLPEYSDAKDTLFQELDCYPLLQFRMSRYSEIFSIRSKIKDFLDAHGKRLSWQIMRIYRNRNMIVHDGGYFPYIDIIVQNLHHYVDTLINTISIYAGKGYRSTKTIYNAIQQAEFQRIVFLEEKDSGNRPKAITSDDIINILLDA